jgi:hypothetical protein
MDPLNQFNVPKPGEDAMWRVAQAMLKAQNGPLQGADYMGPEDATDMSLEQYHGTPVDLGEESPPYADVSGPGMPSNNGPLPLGLEQAGYRRGDYEGMEDYGGDGMDDYDDPRSPNHYLNNLQDPSLDRPEAAIAKAMLMRQQGQMPQY